MAARQGDVEHGQQKIGPIGKTCCKPEHHVRRQTHIAWGGGHHAEPGRPEHFIQIADQ